MIQAATDQIAFLARHRRVHDALSELNAHTGCRFSAIFKFEEEALKNLVLVDRDQQSAPLMATIPIEQSYCLYIQQNPSVFVVHDSLSDMRVEGHPKQSVVRTYHGYPLTDESGKLFGTLCHFDFDVVEVSSDAASMSMTFSQNFHLSAIEAGVQEDIDRRIESLRLMRELILSSSDTSAQAIESFETYAQPLRADADRDLSEKSAKRVRDKLASMQADISHDKTFDPKS